jgi:hypothetical protein
MDMGGGQQMTGQGEGRYEGEDSAMTMTMDMGGQQMEMRFVDKALYLKMPEGMPGADPGKPWIKIEPGGDDPMSRALGDMDQMADQNDPRKILEQVEKAGTITATNEDAELDGQDATHYTVDLELAKIAEDNPGGMPEETLREIQEAGVDTIPMELWLNDDDLPIQVVMDLSELVSAAAESSGQEAPQGIGAMTMKYTDWGADVDVTAPADDEIGEMPTMPN